jgi:hypothetical protein
MCAAAPAPVILTRLLAKGQTVENLGVYANWTKISYNGKTAM